MSAGKVILCVDSLESGGAQRQIVVLANALEERGYEVVVLTHYPGDQLGQFLAAGVRRDFLPRHSRYDAAFILRMARYLKQEAPDCLISYLTTTNFFARTAGRLAGINNIITSERSTSLGAGRLTRLRERLLARWSSSIVVNSHQGRRNLISEGLPAERITVIYNGLDTRQFSRRPPEECAALRRSLGISPQEFLALLPGRMSEEKNHILLVEALIRMGSRGSHVRVAFAGNEFYPETRHRIVERITAANATGQFLFLGPRTDMPLLYSAADVVVLPSRWEGFPNVIVEAMACETPVVASDIADNGLIIGNGVTGYLFDSNDADQLATSLQSVIDLSPEQRRAMGMRAADVARELCSIDSFATRYIALVERGRRSNA